MDQLLHLIVTKNELHFFFFLFGSQEDVEWGKLNIATLDLGAISLLKEVQTQVDISSR